MVLKSLFYTYGFILGCFKSGSKENSHIAFDTQAYIMIYSLKLDFFFPVVFLSLNFAESIAVVSAVFLCPLYEIQSLGLYQQWYL